MGKRVKMKLLSKTLIAAVLALLPLLSFAMVPAIAHAEESGDVEVTVDQPANTEESAESTNTNTYDYVAQSGDSYTKIARKAVQTYGIINGVNLTPAGIIFAETTLTHEAGSPALNLGQTVSINETAIEDVVEKAVSLTDSQQAAWNYYVQFVNFNTDNVGQTN